jgi:hypothetical protein
MMEEANFYVALAYAISACLMVGFFAAKIAAWLKVRDRRLRDEKI